MFWRKKTETLRGHISQKSSSRIFWAGWLFPKNVPNISSDTIPLQSCWRYLPPIVLAEISLTPEYVQTGQFFLYTKQNLHQKMFTPKNFFTRRGFTPNSFYIKTPTANELHYFYSRNQTVFRQSARRATFTPEDVYTWIVYIPKFLNTKTFLTSQPVQQNMSTSEAICAKYIVFDLKRLLHPRHFTPKSFYTKAFLH